jgi:GT2 family glycosyltransferase
LSDVTRTMRGLGVVVIGRNEGERLHRCLESMVGRGLPIVYVDSNSIDGSISYAHAMGVNVVELDLSRPFTAARARNAGFERLCEVASAVRFVQFIDGDCELAAGWLERACAVLEESSEVAAVCGRLRERFPEHSVYNRLADLEWDAPAGEIKACGGVAMLRAEAFRTVRGFDPTIIAAEDDELCLRIRQRGWKIVRIDTEMALHDMAMTRFGQWWRRSTRTGHAYAEGTALHGRPPENHFVRETRSTIFWGMFVPLVAFALAWPTHGISLILLGGYCLLYLRIRRYYVAQRGWPTADARLYAAWIVLAKFPHAIGLLRYWLGRLSGKRSVVIEHRDIISPGGSGVGWTKTAPAAVTTRESCE